mgnify:CR=1 FL=1
MDLFSGIANFLTGGLGSKIVDTVVGQFPNKLSEEEKKELEAVAITATRNFELELLALAKDQDQEFNKRLREMEGTAKDLQQFGWLGKLVVFLRGLQRPLWGYGVLYMDFMVFSGKWSLTDFVSLSGGGGVNLGENLESAFWVINFLVLGFLFGERAMKNVMPLLKGVMNGK